MILTGRAYLQLMDDVCAAICAAGWAGLTSTELWVRFGARFGNRKKSGEVKLQATKQFKEMLRRLASDGRIRLSARKAAKGTLVWMPPKKKR